MHSVSSCENSAVLAIRAWNQHCLSGIFFNLSSNFLQESYCIVYVLERTSSHQQFVFAFNHIFLTFFFRFKLYSNIMIRPICAFGCIVYFQPISRDRMVVGFITTYAISAYHHWCCEFESRSGRGVLDTALYDKVCQWLVTGRWFSLGARVCSTNKAECHDIAEILLKVVLNTITLTP